MTKRKVVIVTGATAGVGRATVRLFAKKGAYLGLLARDSERLQATKTEVESLGSQAIAIPTDVSNFNMMEKATQKIVEEFGPPNIWINNAMVSVFSPVKKMEPEEYERVTKVTYLGYVYGTLIALKYMLPKDSGIIIQVSSGLAHRAIPLQSAYCASKHAVKGFTESLMTELIHDKSNVKISMVNLPAVNTPQFSWVKSRLPRKPQPLPPIFQPEVAANAILWATEHYRRQWNVGFPTTFVILANKIAPNLVDHYLARKGYNGQQYNGLADANKPNNLYEPVPGNFDAHGEFDSRAQSHSIEFWLSKHRLFIFLLFITLIVILYFSSDLFEMYQK